MFPELPTEFVKSLKDVNCMEKETAVFCCEVTSTNDPIKWLKQGFEISSSDKRFEVITEGYTLKLVIKDARLDDHGEYTCVVGNKKTSAILFVEGKFIHPFSEIQICACFLKMVSLSYSRVVWGSGMFNQLVHLFNRLFKCF